MCMIAFRIYPGGMVMAGTVVLIGLGAMVGHVAAGLALGTMTVASLLLHECGHLLAARIFGVPVREIGLCLKGTYIRREKARAPLDDFAISLSGPLVNAMTAAVLWSLPGLWHWLAIYNLTLLVSNLAPLPGSDGRRAYTAWTRVAEQTCTSVAVDKKR